MAAKLPHQGVFVRLGLSAVHGIGVFAIRPIPAGTDIFASDTVPLVWVSKAELEQAGLTPAERALYHDFGINRGDTIGCPADFHNLTPGWYLNEPAPGAEANVRSTDRLSFIACRDIAEGEELSIDYEGFSDQGGSPLRGG
ncbi:MAG TPA: SET domain-containing protein [Allosphingosinicella sp.]|nr:SET domain-containing protein [Allosphingosinicella sp.]